MAKSKAKKRREKLVREGKHNPNSIRSVYAETEIYKQMQSKVTETKRGKLEKNYHKHKKRLSFHLNDQDNRFFYIHVYYLVEAS